AQHLSERGGELSPSSARARRCGMFDVAALRYAVRVNGLSALALTKLDVLSGLESVPLCVGYELDGEVFQEPPLVGLARVQPLVETLPGWTEPLADCRSWDDLPAAARRYVETIEQSGGVKIEWIGVGSDRSQTIVRS
ncbi:MAG: adenylosuccinate synthetase, partial [Sandaracinaceae bacterium]|nr:adenylosuccinate synthetase [Sandaracinaceae bacterium]